MTQATMTSPELTLEQFASISGLVRRLSGIHLSESKTALVRARLNKRLRTLGLGDFGQYLDRIRDDADGWETANLLDSLSTNLTFFFREARHFEALRSAVLPGLLARHRRDRRLRFWSAGCSSGEEPLSIAITLHEAMAGAGGWDVGVLATDLSMRMLWRARTGRYDPDSLRETPRHLVEKYFIEELDESGRPAYRVRDSVRRMVHLAQLNLMNSWPMKGPFDVIFCRNVMIYFDKGTQATLVQRFYDLLAPGGVLFIGHSESLTGVPHRFRYVEPTVYAKA